MPYVLWLFTTVYGGATTSQLLGALIFAFRALLIHGLYRDYHVLITRNSVGISNSRPTKLVFLSEGISFNQASCNQLSVKLSVKHWRK